MEDLKRILGFLSSNDVKFLDAVQVVTVYVLNKRTACVCGLAKVTVIEELI